MEISVFQYTEYKSFVLEAARLLGGRGQFRKMALHLGVHPTLITLIFRGDRHLTSDQAADLCSYLHLSEIESDYFVTLVELQRAGRPGLRQLLERRKERLKQALGQLGTYRM
ncbi:MAG: hypothetical protein HYR96_11635 [Deltaproteobacteria bacterium]|nr:hypothetical protein [Deltaproteobacteria bacterium]MBI3294953.1 hypothetical protein [Deltaproteobacteria bacterium]